jgi:hypothetical protein
VHSHRFDFEIKASLFRTVSDCADLYLTSGNHLVIKSIPH